MKLSQINVRPIHHNVWSLHAQWMPEVSGV